MRAVPAAHVTVSLRLVLKFHAQGQTCPLTVIKAVPVCRTYSRGFCRFSRTQSPQASLVPGRFLACLFKVLVPDPTVGPPSVRWDSELRGPAGAFWRCARQLPSFSTQQRHGGRAG